MRFTPIAVLLFAAACTDAPPTGTFTAQVTCFHTSTAVACKQGGPSDAERTKVEDFYPSACLDGDADGDGTADFLDLDFLGSDGSDATFDDDLRCPKCNRGPGTQNDFRLRLAGTAAELDRGKVYVRHGDVLTIPTPDGVLYVRIDASTELEDGDPTPGAEIRVEGEVAGTEVVATRLKVLCPGPEAMPPAEVPPEAEEPAPDPAEPVIE